MINYRGTPLFGEGSSVSHTSEFFAISGTVLFWLIFMIFAFVIKPQPKKPLYKEVQILLSSTPVVEETEEAAAPAEQAAASASSSEGIVADTPKNVETPKVFDAPSTAKIETSKNQFQTQPKPQPKSQTKKETPKTAEPVQYAKRVEDLMSDQFQNKKKQKTFREDLFDDEEEKQQQSEKVFVDTESSIQGNAGDISNNKGKIESEKQNSSTEEESSQNTKNSLAKVNKATSLGTAPDGIQSESSVKTKTSGSGKVELEMGDGRFRALINPAEPKINLSQAAAATVDTSIDLKITFKVLENGNVIEVKIDKESMLSSIVKKEIIEQIMLWQFEPADYVAKATLPHKIKKQ